MNHVSLFVLKQDFDVYCALFVDGIAAAVASVILIDNLAINDLLWSLDHRGNNLLFLLLLVGALCFSRLLDDLFYDLWFDFLDSDHKFVVS